MTADTIRSLCATLDDGDDSVLPILADAMEELAGVRGPAREGLLCYWKAGGPAKAGLIPESVLNRLRGGRHLRRMDDVPVCIYRSRVAAYLALVEALMGDDT